MVPSTYHFDQKFCFFVTILKYYIFMKKRNFFHVSNLKSEDMKKLRKILRLFWYLWLPKMTIKNFFLKIHIFSYIFFFSKKKCKWLIKWRKLPQFHRCNFCPNPTDTNWNLLDLRSVFAVTTMFLSQQIATVSRWCDSVAIRHDSVAICCDCSTKNIIFCSHRDSKKLEINSYLRHCQRYDPATWDPTRSQLKGFMVGFPYF